MFAYYTKERPPMPGCIPSDGLLEIECFASRCYVPEAQCKAWGIAYYDRQLTEREINDYELQEVSFKR